MSEMHLPKHVALIMDGNRRWARARGVEEAEGHRTGRDGIKPLIKYGMDVGIEVMTFWAFSTKNFKRDAEFLRQLFGVFRETLGLKSWFDEIREAGGEIRIIGDLSGFPADIVQKICGYLESSKIDNPRMIVNFALGYEGRDEIVRAVRKMVEAGEDVAAIDEEMMDRYVDTAGLPDPDLLIRTGGDIRVSGYMLWQLADTELYFTETLWPDFNVECLKEALAEYAARERRFGR